MDSQITIPFWVFICLVLIAGLTLLKLILIPSVRWFLRRRINRVIDEISSRLDIEIRPFQLTKRQVLIDRLVYDPKVIEAIQKRAQEDQIPREVVQAEIMTYAREIVPSFNAYLYFRLGYWMAKRLARLLYGVRVGFVDNEGMANIEPDSTVIFVMNHRSNMDYILVAFLAAERTALSYAVGEWARIWPLQALIRAMGAFFVRRDSGNPLYRLVLERYIHMATKEGVGQAVFIEGGLSRDGRLRKPKLGLLDYMLRGFDFEQDRDIVFIPVGINYDRTLEDRSLLRALDPHAVRRSGWFVIKTTLGFIWHNLLLMVFNRWQRFGYACVNFASPISMKAFCSSRHINLSRIEREARFFIVKEIGDQLMASIGRVIPVLPVSLVAAVLLQNDIRWMSDFDIKSNVHRLIEHIETQGVPLYHPQRGWEKAITTAFNMLKIRRMVDESEGSFRANPDSHGILSYYANAIEPWIHQPLRGEGRG